VNYRDPKGQELACPEGYDPDDPGPDCEIPSATIPGGVDCMADPEAPDCAADRVVLTNQEFQHCVTDGDNTASAHRRKAFYNFQQDFIQAALIGGATAALGAFVKGLGPEGAVIAGVITAGHFIITGTPLLLASEATYDQTIYQRALAAVQVNCEKERQIILAN